MNNLNKEEMAKRIQNITNINDLKKIEYTIKKYNPSLIIPNSENTQYIPFHKLTKITYEKLDKILKKINENKQPKLRISVKISKNTTRINITQGLNDSPIIDFD